MRFKILLFFTLQFLTPLKHTHNSRIIREFSLITKEGFYLWIFGVVSELARGLACSTRYYLHFLTALSKVLLLLLRRRRDLALKSGRLWSGHGRNGTASTFHTSLGVTANFLYCSFDWKHIGNIFSWSHLWLTKERKAKKGGSKKEVQNMTKCTELTLDLTFFFNFYFSKLD